jgi:toxin secretion/phage lysis holin
MYAIIKENHGFWKAIVNKKLSSRRFIEGFISKSIFYFIILSMANFAETTSQIAIVGGIVSTVFYVGLFYYETISILENFRDMGFNLANGFLHKLKKQKNELLGIGKNDKVDDEINNEEIK